MKRPRRQTPDRGFSMRMRRSAVVLAGGAVVAASLGAALPSAAAAAPRPTTAVYQLVLGPANSQYVGINNRGDIIGIGVDAAAFGREEGFIINAGTTTRVFLGAPGDETDQSTDTRPRAINDQGVVVGNYQKNELLPGGVEATIPRPATWPDDGTGSDLGVNPTGDADAFGINGNQQIVGTQAGNTVTPWLLQGTTVTNLPTFHGSSTAEALAVSSNGVVVGDAEPTSGDQVAAEWVNGKISSLGTLNGGTWGEALAINGSGQAVGSATTPGSPINLSHAVMFSNGQAIDLNVPGVGQGSAHATAINVNGVIVGDDGIDPDLLDVGNGFIFQNGRATELNTLIAPTPNVRLAGATGINDAGDIVGIAAVTQSDGSQISEGYELLPITTP
jgi:probable HAF family extracellular repeat protein